MQFFNPGQNKINKKLYLFSLLADKLSFWFYFFSGKHQAVKSSMTASQDEFSRCYVCVYLTLRGQKRIPQDKQKSSNWNQTKKPTKLISIFNRTGTEQLATSAHKMPWFVLLLWTGCNGIGRGEDMETGKKGWSNLLDVATLSSLSLTVMTVLFTHPWEKHTLSVYPLLLCRSEAKAFGNCSPTVNIIKEERQVKEKWQKV